MDPRNDPVPTSSASRATPFTSQRFSRSGMSMAAARATIVEATYTVLGRAASRRTPWSGGAWTGAVGPCVRKACGPRISSDFQPRSARQGARRGCCARRRRWSAIGLDRRPRRPAGRGSCEPRGEHPVTRRSCQPSSSSDSATATAAVRLRTRVAARGNRQVGSAVRSGAPNPRSNRLARSWQRDVLLPRHGARYQEAAVREQVVVVTSRTRCHRAAAHA